MFNLLERSISKFPLNVDLSKKFLSPPYKIPSWPVNPADKKYEELFVPPETEILFVIIGASILKISFCQSVPSPKFEISVNINPPPDETLISFNIAAYSEAFKTPIVFSGDCCPYDVLKVNLASWFLDPLLVVITITPLPPLTPYSAVVDASFKTEILSISEGSKEFISSKLWLIPSTITNGSLPV